MVCVSRAVRFGTVLGCCVAFSAGFGEAQNLSPVRSVTPQEGGSISGFSVDPIDRRSVFGWDAFSGQEQSGTTPKRGVIGIASALGVVLDYSSGMPRLRGITLSQGENVRLMATGRIDSDLEDIAGQLSVQFRF